MLLFLFECLPRLYLHLVVEYLISEYAFEPLRQLLRHLGDGTDINVALAARFAPLNELDVAFADFAREFADAFAPGVDLSPSDAAGGPLQQLLAVPNLSGVTLNFDQIRAAVQRHIEAEEWIRARETLEPLLAQNVYFPGSENIHTLHAQICRALDDTAGEKDALLTILSHESGQLPAVTRLLTLAQEAENWTEVAQWSDAWLAIDPLAATPWRARLNAHTALDQPAIAISAGETLLQLDPPDRVSIHHQVARLLEPSDTAAARRHVLQALEDAPRFQAAYELLERIPSTTVQVSP